MFHSRETIISNLIAVMKQRKWQNVLLLLFLFCFFVVVFFLGGVGGGGLGIFFLGGGVNLFLQLVDYCICTAAGRSG